MSLAVQKMFDGIANRYDFLNHFLSAGRDRVWRRKASAYLGNPKHLRILDLCGGTGDFWHTWVNGKTEAKDLTFCVPSARVATNPSTSIKIPRSVIADFSMHMLLEAKYKLLKSERNIFPGPKPYLVQMDALKPCFKDARFDAVICAYGMRNLDSIPMGIDAMRFLIRPGGTFLTLEFFRPTTWFTKLFYGGVAPLCIPFLGWIFSSRKEAYIYLVASIRKFLSVNEYGEVFAQRGFKDIAIIPCDFGISHIVKAVKG